MGEQETNKQLRDSMEHKAVDEVDSCGKIFEAKAPRIDLMNLLECDENNEESKKSDEPENTSDEPKKRSLSADNTETSFGSGGKTDSQSTIKQVQCITNNNNKTVRRFQFKRPQILRSKSVDALLLSCRCDRKVTELFKSFERLDCGNTNNSNVNSETGAIENTEVKLPSDLMTRSEIIGTNAHMQASAGPGRRAVNAVTRGLRRLVRKHCSSLDISTPDPEFKVAYLGNVVTGWAKGEPSFNLI
ncbi:uncharacterized protein LOC113382356 [Ctenocephalides felis]|uniref:uncharacterized protein LOC113382356 n=1 Tax=Ctenocephalides felis TaxID=7515 RepID=UPI000E6E2523|nr:uncharacterized protein LOC113382356 [Ctenocephalides felis]